MEDINVESLKKRYSELSKKRDSLKQESVTLNTRKKVALEEQEKLLKELKDKFGVSTYDEGVILLSQKQKEIEEKVSSLEGYFDSIDKSFKDSEQVITEDKLF